MKNLITKYRNETITPEELAELREKLSKITKKDLDSAMLSDWKDVMKMDYDECPGKEETLDVIHVLNKQKRTNRIKLAISVCAACILTVVISGVILLAIGVLPTSSDRNFEVSTAVDEMASVTLPDNSQVKLNSESQLTYIAPSRKNKSRDIEFEGEGYFKIYPDTKHPFVITSGDLTVTVTGTEFNFNSDCGNNMASLYLLNGGVVMASKTTGNRINVKPGQRAEFNRITGSFSVSKPTENENITAWYSGEIHFESASLDSVIKFLEEHYNCTLKTTYIPDSLTESELGSLHFSGTLPTGNLPLALRTIERIYAIRLSPEIFTH